MSVIKVISALILTRLLYPEAYGIVSIVVAIYVMVELSSDIGASAFVIHNKHAEQPQYINTLWSVRLARGCANCVILFVCAPLIASAYETPLLTDAIRICSLASLLHGLESMSFLLAIRRQRARVVSYSELCAAVVSTCFVIGYSYHVRDHTGMIYGMLLHRALLTLTSYFFYRDLRLRLQFDRDVVKSLLGFTKYVMPSSIVTLLSGQFDKIVFLRLFDLHLMGLYGLAGNIGGSIDTFTTDVTRRILFPRAAHAHRTDPAGVRDAYYAQNVKLFSAVIFLPAAVGGAAHFIVEFLFDARYAFAGVMLQALMIQSMLLAFSTPAEQLLAGAGHMRITLIDSILRFAWMVLASLGGYYLFGFPGFLYGYVLNVLPALVFNIWLQHREGLLLPKYELVKAAFAGVVFVAFVLIGKAMSASGLTISTLLRG